MTTVTCACGWTYTAAPGARGPILALIAHREYVHSTRWVSAK